MARRRGRRTKKQERLSRYAGLALAALLFAFCCVVTAGEHYGWPTPRWSEVEAWFGVADAPAGPPPSMITSQSFSPIRFLLTEIASRPCEQLLHLPRKRRISLKSASVQ